MSSVPATAAPAERVTSTAERIKVGAAVIVGTTIEWYDFFIYAFAANLVFAPLFFEPAGKTAGFLLSLLTIGLSFLFRPLGAFLAGHFGDRIGRRPMLVITLILMGGATTAIGLLPTYTGIGLAAPILLVGLRIVQGIAAGGEWGGAVLMSVEHAPRGKRGLFGAFPQLGVPLGMILASAILALTSTVARGDAFMTWGWRVPFLVSIVLVFIGFVIRRTVEESPIFTEMAEHRKRESAPIVEVFRSYGGLVILSALLFAGNNAVGYMTTGGYIQGMATRPIEEGGFGYNPVHVQLAVLGAAAVWFLSTLISGWLCDIFGRKAILLIGFAITLVTVVFLFEAAKNGPLGIFMGTGLVSIGLGFTYGPQAVMYAETFPAHIRFSGVAISYAIGAILGGAFAPTIAQTLLSSTGTTWSIVIYLGVMTLVGAAATALLRERRDVPLSIEAEEDGTWAAWRGDKVDPSPAPVR